LVVGLNVARMLTVGSVTWVFYSVISLITSWLAWVFTCSWLTPSCWAAQAAGTRSRHKTNRRSFSSGIDIQPPCGQVTLKSIQTSSEIERRQLHLITKYVRHFKCLTYFVSTPPPSCLHYCQDCEIFFFIFINFFGMNLLLLKSNSNSKSLGTCENYQTLTKCGMRCPSYCRRLIRNAAVTVTVTVYNWL